MALPAGTLGINMHLSRQEGVLAERGGNGHVTPTASLAGGPGGRYHLMDRGHDRQPIFADEENYRAFLELVGRYRDRFGYRLYHSCLMTNHFHLLVQLQDPPQVSPLMAGVAAGLRPPLPPAARLRRPSLSGPLPAEGREGVRGANSGQDVLPQFRSDKAREMANVGGGNHDVGRAKRQGLSGKDPVGVNGVVARGRLSLLACLGPEFGCPAHRCGREREVFHGLPERIEPANGFGPIHSQ